MTEPGDPLTAAIRGLVADGTLSPVQAERVDAAVRPLGAVPAGAGTGERSGVLTEVLAYVGGALVVGALVLLVGLAWSDLAPPARVAICTGAAAVLLAAGLVVSRSRFPADAGRRRTLASALGLLAAVGAAFAAHAAFELDDPWTLVPPGIALVAVGVAGYAVWRGGPAVTAVFGGGLLLVYTLIAAGPDGWDSGVGIGLAFVAYGIVFAALGLGVPERHVAGVLGGVLAIVGAEVTAVDDEHAVVGLLLGIAVVAGACVLFWHARRWWYAVLAAVTALVVPPTALGVLLDDAIVGAVVLLAVGVLLVVAAVVLLRGRRPRPPAPS